MLLTVVCCVSEKCEQYWCEEVGEGLEMEAVQLSLITTSITTHRDFVIRTMNKIGMARSRWQGDEVTYM